jgi:DNA-binding beta-propeller fold protein YncE
MKQHKNSIVVLVAGMLLLGSGMSHAAQAKFNIVPFNGATTTFLLNNNFIENISYQVTNQTSLTRTLTMVPISGISQTTTAPGSCQTPFTLAPQQSCTLSLVIDGSQIPSTGINGGPVICKTKSSNDSSADPFLCSQPSASNALAVSTTGSSGQHAYIANQLNNSVSYCQTNPATGLLSQCRITATGLDGLEGIGFNPAGTIFYSANALNNTISVCTANTSTGALSNCVDSGGSGFNLPNAVTLSPNGSIFYTANLGNNSVSACLVNPTTGLLSGCVNNTSPTYGAPADMAVNGTGTFAYVANRSKSTISVCNVAGQTVSSCNDLSGSFINEPEGITISLSGLHIYIANAGSRQLVVCDILQDGTGLLANCSTTNGQFEGTGNIGLNNLNTEAYVPNQLLGVVFKCDVDSVSGQLSLCVPSGGLGFVGPAGVVLQ